ncbi:MAG: methyl-accepting chemotaxis protein [Chthoniobacteraceae bacterium]
MNNNSRVSFWNRLNVGPKMAIIPFFFIIATATIIIYTVVTVEGQKGDALLIEFAGRQRMLHQKQFAETLMVSQGLAPREDLEYARKLWLDTQDALINGGRVVARLGQSATDELPPAPTDTIKGKLLEYKKLADQAVTKSEAMLKLKPGEPEYAAKLKELIDMESGLQELGIDQVKLYTHYSEAKSETMIKWEMVIGITVAIVGILFSWFISRGIVIPLGSVVSVAQRIAKGDLRGEKLKNDSRDEIGQLGEVFNNMVDSLKDLTGQILSVTGNVNSAAQEIMASTQQQASGTKEQAATVQEITSTMQELTQSGSEIAERAKQVAAAAEATSVASRSGVQAVQDTNRTMEAIREQVEEVAEKIVALSQKTQAVGEIVSTVNDIAEQSNLLALNATIEAAAAGDQGSRFSVVANEMKHLADRAKECTVQVRTILGDIQKGINSSVMLTEEGVKRVEVGKQQADVTEQTINEMNSTTIESVKAFQQIIGASNQQQIGFEQVTQGMRDIRQAAEQTAAGTSQLEKAVSSLNALSHQLRAAVEQYKL